MADDYYLWVRWEASANDRLTAAAVVVVVVCSCASTWPVDDYTLTHRTDTHTHPTTIYGFFGTPICNEREDKRETS